MIIFLYGPDDYRRRQKEKFYAAEFAKKHFSLGIARFDFREEGGFEAFLDFLENRSLFDPFKLALLENVFETAHKEAAPVLRGLTESGRETTILLSEPSLPPKPFGFLLKAPVIFEKFEYLSGYEWEMFIRKEAKQTGVSLSPSALEFLKTVYVGNPWGLVTELQKVSFLDNAKEKPLEDKDCAALEVSTVSNFWAVLNSLKSPDFRRRIGALERLFLDNEPAQKIFYMIAYQWPEKIGAIAAYDRGIKSGKLEYEEALVDLVLS